MKFTESITIQAPVSTVFNTFTDLRNAERNLSGIINLKIINGPEKMEVGTKWQETRSIMGHESTEEMWVIALTRNKSYTVAAESHGTKYKSVFTFTSSGGNTKVVRVFEDAPQTLTASLMSFSLISLAFAGALQKMLRKDLKDLKNVCEHK